MQRMLLAMLACFYSANLFAQINVSVIISGLESELENNVRLFLSIEQQKEHPLLSDARLRRLHKKAPLEISNALQPFGYYHPVIKSELSQPTPGQWLASYVIDPGATIPIGQFNLEISEEMRKDPEFATITKNFPLRVGEAFNHIVYEKFKSDLAKFAAERGYFRARFVEHRVEIDLAANEARIFLHYDAGPRFRFGEVELKQDVLEAKLVKRYIPFEQGDPYTVYQLVDLQQALNDSDYFRTVEVSPGQPQENTMEIPISVALTPRKPNRYSFGLGYGTDTGARARFGWERPRLNRRGHRFNTNARVSQIGYSLSAHYRVPILDPRTDQMIYSAGVVNEKTDSSESTVRTVGASLNRGRGAWREAVSLNYQKEEFTIADEKNDSTLLMPSVQWSRTWGRDFINTLDGFRFDIRLRGASEKIISDTNFSQLQGGIKAITPLGHQNRIIARGRLGSTWVEEFEQLPSSVRYFAGGAQSVRGYAYQSLGPVDEKGNVVGGKHLMIGSIELEHNFDNKWGVAVFYDGGNAIDDLKDKLARGAGIGVRWKSPVGPVRIDLASALSKDGNPWRLHINIGPDL